MSLKYYEDYNYTLSELIEKEKLTFDEITAEDVLVIYIPNTTTVISHLLTQLLFRLENLPSKNLVFLGGSAELTSREYWLGNYTSKEDTLEKATERLTRKYSSHFTTKVLVGDTISINDIVREVRTDGKLHVIEITNNYKKDKLHSIKSNVDRSIYPNRLIEGGISYTTINYSVTNESSVTRYGMNVMNYNSTRDEITGSDLGEINNSVGRHNLGKLQIDNLMLSNYIFNAINSIVTTDMGIDYTGLVYNTKEDKVTHVYYVPVKLYNIGRIDSRYYAEGLTSIQITELSKKLNDSHYTEQAESMMQNFIDTPSYMTASEEMVYNMTGGTERESYRQRNILSDVKFTVKSLIDIYTIIADASTEATEEVGNYLMLLQTAQNIVTELMYDSAHVRTLNDGYMAISELDITGDEVIIKDERFSESEQYGYLLYLVTLIISYTRGQLKLK